MAAMIVNIRPEQLRKGKEKSEQYAAARPEKGMSFHMFISEVR